MSLKWPLPNKPRSASIGSGGAPTAGQADCIPLTLPKLDLLSYRLSLKPVIPKREPVDGPTNTDHVAPHGTPLPSKPDVAGPAAGSQQSQQPFQLAASLLGIPSHGLVGQTPGPQTPISTLASTLAGSAYPMAATAISTPAAHSTVAPVGTSSAPQDPGHVSLLPGWRIRWACYVASAPLTASSLPKTSPLTSWSQRDTSLSRLKPPTSANTQASPSDVFAFNVLSPRPPSALMPVQRPISARGVSVLGKRRSRTVSIISQTEPKRPRMTSGSSSLFRRRPPSSASATRPQSGLGNAAETAVRKALRNLEHLNRPALDILLEAKSRWDKSANVEGQPSGRQSSNPSVDNKPVAENAKTSPAGAAPKLPDRVSYLQAVQTQSDVPTVEHKLWLFALVEPGRQHPLDELDVDYFGSFDGIEIHNSGSFTSQDIFPTLYNENGLYAPPEARPLRQFSSCLNIGDPAHSELSKASNLFLDACRHYLVQHMRENCQLSGYGRGIDTDVGVIWAAKSSPDDDPSTALYYSLDLQYDHEGLLVKGFLETLPHIGMPQLVQPTANTLQYAGPGAGDSILLLPINVTATFVRKYGHEASSSALHNAVTARQAAAEQQRIRETAKLKVTATSSASDDVEVDRDDQRWLCRIAGVDLVWSAGQCLTLKEPSEETSSRAHTVRTVTDVEAAALLEQNTLDRSIALTSACIDRLVEDRERQRNRDAKNPVLGSNAQPMASNVASPQQPGQLGQSYTCHATLRPQTGQTAPKWPKSLSELAAFLPAPTAANRSFTSLTEVSGVVPVQVPPLASTHTPNDQTSLSNTKTVLQPGSTDAFSDFLWTDFSSFGAHDRSRTHMRDLDYSSGLTGMFDAQITEDDFSFFDTPALPSADVMHGLLPETSALPAGPADFAFVTSSEPIDHFGHLMPSGSSPALTIASNSTTGYHSLPYASTSYTVPFSSVVDNDVAYKQQAYEPPLGNGLPTSMNSFATPEGLGMTPSPNNTAVVVQEQPRKPGKYDIVSASGQQSQSLHTTCAKFVEVALRCGENAAAPVHLREEPCRTYTGVAAVDLQMQERSKLLVKHVGRSQRNKDDLTKAIQLRTWSSPTDSSGLTFDSSSSDDSTDDEAPSPFDVAELLTTAAEPTDRHTGAEYIMMRDVLHGPSICAVLRDTLPVIIDSVETSTVDDKLSKSEKEALLSIFFVQITENPAFRREYHATAARRAGIDSHVAGSQTKAFSAFTPLFSTHASSTTIKLDRTNSPQISVVYHSASMRMNASALHHWDVLGLQPVSGDKRAFTKVICAATLATSSVQQAVKGWLGNIDTAWTTGNLGSPGAHSNAETGLLVLDTGKKGLTDVAEEVLAEKLAPLQHQVIRQTEVTGTGIVYILLSDDECRSASRKLMRLCLRVHLLRKGFVPHIIPLSTIVGPSTRTSLITARRIYDRIPVMSERFKPYLSQTNQTLQLLGQSFRQCPAPSFKLSSATRQPPIFSMTWPPQTLDILAKNRLLHVAYDITDNGRILAMSLIDEKAEHHCTRARWVEHLDNKAIVKRVWTFLKDIAHAVSMEWRVVIIKASFMDRAEIQTWSDFLVTTTAAAGRPMSVSLCSLGLAVEVAESKGTQTSATSARDALQAHGRTSSLACYSYHPTAVFAPEQTFSPALPLSSIRQRAYFALSASSIYFVDRRLPLPNAHLLPPPKAARSYTIHFLLAIASPTCSYPLLLGRHVREVTQSFVDLQLITTERWALHEEDVEALPWHLAAVRTLCRYDVSQVFSDT